MNSKEKAILLLMKAGIKSVNKNVDLSGVLRDSDGEYRTLNFEITDAQNIQTGFTMVADPIHGPMMKEVGHITNPNVTLKVSKNTFLALCLQKISIPEAVFYGDADFVGEKWLRDYRIFEPIFTEFGKVLKDVVPPSQR